MFKVLPVVLLLFSFSVCAETITEQRQQQLLHLLHQDCGSCHGMTLKGGLGPALTAEAMKDKPLEMITLTIREGRPGTPMPPWKHLLSEADIEWLANTLKQQQLTQK